MQRAEMCLRPYSSINGLAHKLIVIAHDQLCFKLA